ncbi:hypothetical protein QBC46DRAFT_404961 [Diplogelasinospora grovesii]|uniref:Protein kinase domain-containing protein n=1 Tax=Diplogelasinospora grovesii TaxID=303347 RepID=A0AAN6S8B8_9PEZI|nr:hypothetical protein QBC46DRAFT_404961 [Diplogelasinospora grovesii]
MLGIRVQDIRFELHSESFRARVHTYERHPHVLRTDLISGPCQSLPLVVVLKLHDDRELFEKEERFYKTFESERIPQFYGTTTIDSKPALVLSYIEGTPLDDLDDSYLGSLIDLQTKVLDLMRCLRDSGVILEDYAPRNFILNGEALFVVDFEAWEESPAVQQRWPDDKNLEELLQIRAETIIEKVKDLIESRIRNR